MQTKTTEHFYTAGRSITGLQNGMALAGDYISAASFLASWCASRSRSFLVGTVVSLLTPEPGVALTLQELEHQMHLGDRTPGA